MIPSELAHGVSLKIMPDMSGIVVFTEQDFLTHLIPFTSTDLVPPYEKLEDEDAITWLFSELSVEDNRDLVDFLDKYGILEN